MSKPGTPWSVKNIARSIQFGFSGFLFSPASRNAPFGWGKDTVGMEYPDVILRNMAGLSGAMTNKVLFAGNAISVVNEVVTTWDSAHPNGILRGFAADNYQGLYVLPVKSLRCITFNPGDAWNFSSGVQATTVCDYAQNSKIYRGGRIVGDISSLADSESSFTGEGSEYRSIIKFKSAKFSESPDDPLDAYFNVGDTRTKQVSNQFDPGRQLTSDYVDPGSSYYSGVYFPLAGNTRLYNVVGAYRLGNYEVVVTSHYTGKSTKVYYAASGAGEIASSWTLALTINHGEYLGSIPIANAYFAGAANVTVKRDGSEFAGLRHFLCRETSSGSGNSYQDSTQYASISFRVSSVIEDDLPTFDILTHTVNAPEYYTCPYSAAGEHTPISPGRYHNVFNSSWSASGSGRHVLAVGYSSAGEYAELEVNISIEESGSESRNYYVSNNITESGGSWVADYSLQVTYQLKMVSGGLEANIGDPFMESHSVDYDNEAYSATYVIPAIRVEIADLFNGVFVLSIRSASSTAPNVTLSEYAQVIRSGASPVTLDSHDFMLTGDVDYNFRNLTLDLSSGYLPPEFIWGTYVIGTVSVSQRCRIPNAFFRASYSDISHILTTYINGPSSYNLPWRQSDSWVVDKNGNILGQRSVINYKAPVKDGIPTILPDSTTPLFYYDVLYRYADDIVIPHALAEIPPVIAKASITSEPLSNVFIRDRFRPREDGEIGGHAIRVI